MVDINQLASLLSQARGPMLDRVTRQVEQFTGDGSVDVMEWLAAVERVCALEEVKPEKVVGFLLDGEPARLYRRLSVENAKQWGVVRKTLVDGYATPMPVVYKRWHGLSLSEGGSLDGYVDTLERLAERLKVGFGSTMFRSKFYAGLPQAIYEWAINRDGAYDDDPTSFGTVLTRIRERMATRQALAIGPKQPVAASAPSASTSGTQRPLKSSSGSSAGCFRCGKTGHRVRDCPVKQQVRLKCWRCNSSSHVLRNCPNPPSRVSCAGAEDQDLPEPPSSPPLRGPVSAAVQEAAEQEPSGSYPWWRYVPSQQLLDWKAVDKEGVTTEGADAPQGFYLEDVDGETASSTRE